MRVSLVIVAAALSLTACDKLKGGSSAPTASNAAAPAGAAAPAPTAEPTGVQISAAPTADTAPTPVSAAAPPTPPAYPPAYPAPAVQVVRWSPADYAKREARLAALIANAETRDTSGETQSRAEEGRYRRAHCTTRACIEQSYAAEEAWLKQWEGSGDTH